MIVFVILDVFGQIQGAIEVGEQLCDLEMTLKTVKAYVGPFNENRVLGYHKL